MPRYCLFGNNVTLANKFESCSQPGKINISPTTHRWGCNDLIGRNESMKTGWDLRATVVLLFDSSCADQREKNPLNRKLNIRKSAVFPLVSNNLPQAFWINALFVCSLSQIAEGSSRVCLHSQEQTGASGQLPGGHPWCLLLLGGLSQTFTSHSEMMSSCRPNRVDFNGA